MNTLVLAAGKIDYTRLPFGMHQSNATIPVNGKPVISWILDDLIKKKITRVSIVIRKENHRLKELLDKYYGSRLSLTITELDEPKSILDSLHEGLEQLQDNEGTRIILGDTLIYDSYLPDHDFMYVSPVRNTENWCIVKLDDNGTIISLTDKKKMEGDKHLALCGYYSFTDTALLKETVSKQRDGGARELSVVLTAYDKLKQIKTAEAENWFDFGHLESFIASKKSLLRPRHFNQLTIHPTLNTISKVSENNDKLKDEMNWYLELPAELKVLTPRIIEQKQEVDKVTITQEFYGYPSLSELFIYGDLDVSVWESIIGYLFKTHSLFKNYKTAPSEDACRDMYITKTFQRIEDLKRQNAYWESLWGYEIVKVNGQDYLNYPRLLQKLEERLTALCRSDFFTIIHGDYCLSNILYDLNNEIVRLVDPRGSFGQKGIYGDPRYDIAKLRHSISGFYDYIVSDLFYLKSRDHDFTFSIFNDDKNLELAVFTDQAIVENGYNLDDIKLIEGLLFLSMIPYHADYFERQKMMYLKGIIILNELCEL